ncbi:hypothetical protein ACFL6C_12115, partial [Myxococcota bacterium]
MSTAHRTRFMGATIAVIVLTASIGCGVGAVGPNTLEIARGDTDHAEVGDPTPDGAPRQSDESGPLGDSSVGDTPGDQGGDSPAGDGPGDTPSGDRNNLGDTFSGDSGMGDSGGDPFVSGDAVCEGHCANSRLDCGESGVDCGGSCTPCAVWFEDEFDNGLSQWNVTTGVGGNVATNESSAYGGGLGLRVETGSSAATKLIHAVSPSRCGTVQVRFYDDMAASKGTLVGIFSAGASQVVLLGVKSNEFPDSYYYRAGANSSANGLDSFIPRALGWHLFELVCTSVGSYGRIDGVNLSYLPSFGGKTAINPDLTEVASITIAAVWLSGGGTYDEIRANDPLPLPPLLERELHFVRLFEENYA